MDARKRQAALDLARGGDGQALGDLLESYRPYVRVMVHSLRDARAQGRFDDSDLIQDALVEAHRSFQDFRGDSIPEFLAWLRQIVLRTTGHTLRGHLAADKRDLGREQSLAGLSSLLADAGSTPSARASRHEQAALVAEAVAQLPEDMQQVVLARSVEGLPHAEIAQRLGRSEDAVRALYVRALRRLRELLKQAESD